MNSTDHSERIAQYANILTRFPDWCQSFHMFPPHQQGLLQRLESVREHYLGLHSLRSMRRWQRA
jgi:hypothetical protein